MEVLILKIKNKKYIQMKHINCYKLQKLIIGVILKHDLDNKKYKEERLFFFLFSCP